MKKIVSCFIFRDWKETFDCSFISNSAWSNASTDDDYQKANQAIGLSIFSELIVKTEEKAWLDDKVVQLWIKEIWLQHLS